MTATRACSGLSLAICLLVSLLATPLWSVADTTLFGEDQPLELELRIDRYALCRRADQVGCEDVPAQLILRTSDESRETLAIRVRTRGEWRLDRSNCSYPPLFLLFGHDTPGTVFEGQDLLPMTTQCRSRGGRYKDWVLREYLAYRIYQLLSDKSVRTRLVRVTWTEPSGNDRSGPYYSFLAEHFRSMAARNNAKILDVDRIDLDTIDPMEMATLDLFQFMIGNTDWSVVGVHNILPIRDISAVGKAGVAGVPFDFDFSGLVFASYADPPPGLPIISTRQRLYRGFCDPAIDWDVLFARFQAIRAQVFDLLEQLPGISSIGRRGARKFLSGFYAILDDPRRRQDRIIGSCRARKF